MSKTGRTKGTKRKKTAEPASGPTPMKRRFGLSRENHPQQDRCVRHYLVRGGRSVERPGGWYRPLVPPLSSLSVGFLTDIRPFHRGLEAGVEGLAASGVAEENYCSSYVLIIA
jgi:hypothetical protein